MSDDWEMDDDSGLYRRKPQQRYAPMNQQYPKVTLKPELPLTPEQRERLRRIDEAYDAEQARLKDEYDAACYRLYAAWNQQRNDVLSEDERGGA